MLLNPGQSSQVSSQDNCSGSYGPAMAGFDASVALVHGLTEVVVHALEPSSAPTGKQVFHILQQPPLIFLDRQDVVGLPAQNLLGYLLLAAHGVNGDDAPRHIQHLEQLGYGRDFIGLVVHLGLTQHQGVLRGPGADHMNGRFPRIAVVGTPQGLAVQGNHLALCHPVDAAHPVHETIPELVRINPGEHPGESVWAGNPVGQFQELPKPLILALGEQLHVVPTLGSPDNRADGHGDDVQELMPFALLPSGILQIAKMLTQSAASHPGHHHPLYRRSVHAHHFSTCTHTFRECVCPVGRPLLFALYARKGYFMKSWGIWCPMLESAHSGPGAGG